jgi:hypothetical protein
MFFKKNPDVQSSQSSGATDNRREPRYSSIARLNIDGFEGEAILRNINRGGFRMESRTYAAVTLGEHYTMRISPETSTGLNTFDLEVEVRWIRSTETSFNAGFLVIKAPRDRAFEKYIEYVRTHNRVEA